MKKTIIINQIAKIEGHAGFLGKILEGDMAKAKIEIYQGSRLIEGLVVGRHFSDVPIITARICGICPVIHSLTAIKALENAFDIKPSEQTEILRKIMLNSQLIHSHALHLFFLTLSDYFEIADDLKLVEKLKKETNHCFVARDWALGLIETIGGRAVHPINSEVGGFKKLPDIKKLIKAQNEYLNIIKSAFVIFDLFKKLKYPRFERKTEYISINHNKEYATYDGNIISTGGLNIKAEQFEKNLQEIRKPYEIVKKVSYNGNTFMVGALARVNNNSNMLNPLAKKAWQSLKIKTPSYNSFHNILAQAVEIIHYVEENNKLFKLIIEKGLKPANTPVRPKKGYGASAAEAPRGTLYHAYEVDTSGMIVKCNIITPTAQFLGNLEADLTLYLNKLGKLNDKKARLEILKMIRAYDPCISCSVH